MTEIAIFAEGLVKRFGDVVALDGVGFRVPAPEGHMTWHRAGFHGGPLVELWDLLAKIQRARAAKDASADVLSPSEKRSSRKKGPNERLHRR
jgi:hypothetical protein